MAYASFSQFLAALEKAGELKRIGVPVATELEITEIADREMKSPGGGKALLFEKPPIAGPGLADSRGDQYHGLATPDGAWRWGSARWTNWPTRCN